MVEREARHFGVCPERMRDPGGDWADFCATKAHCAAKADACQFSPGFPGCARQCSTAGGERGLSRTGNSVQRVASKATGTARGRGVGARMGKALCERRRR